MHRIGLALLGSIALIGSAAAADMPVKMPVKAPIVVYDPWVGLYAGVNIGYSWGNWSATNQQFVPPLGIFNFESTTASPKVNGILGGVQAGYNWRVAPQWILGIEGDAQITGEKASDNWTDPELPPTVNINPNFVLRPGGPATLSSEWKFPWFATLRLRAGYNPSPDWLLFVTGGLAVGESKYSFNFSQPGAALNVPPASTATTYALSANRTAAGFAVGAGTEYKIDRHWSVKAEYLYVDLGTHTINTTDIDGAPFSVSYRVRDHIGRLGLNYFFN
ncbi:MAG: outer membrane protein [Hyphomicrobiales bacterium]